MSSGDGKKRKKNYYKSFAKKRRVGSLETDMTGFLVTFERSESQAVKDCYELLNEYADKIWGPEKTEDKDSKASIEDDIAAELSELKESKDKVRRFQKVKTDVARNFFVTTTVDDPGRLVTSIFEDLKAKHEQRSRFIQRLLPVQTTCKAHLDTIKKKVETVLASYDDSASPEVAYLVAGKIRQNSSLQHKAMLLEIVQVVKSAKPLWTGELHKPDLVLMIDVLQNICCISLMPHYLEFRKYNLLEVTKPQPDSEMPKEPCASVPKDNCEGKNEKLVSDEKAACEGNEKPSDSAKDIRTDAAEAAESKPDSSSSNGGTVEPSTNTSEDENVGSHKAEEASKD